MIMDINMHTPIHLSDCGVHDGLKCNCGYDDYVIAVRAVLKHGVATQMFKECFPNYYGPTTPDLMVIMLAAELLGNRCDSDVIRHEIEYGTPSTPERIATMKRADELYRLWKDKV